MIVIIMMMMMTIMMMMLIIATKVDFKKMQNYAQCQINS